MHREYHKWYSPRLGRDMELLVHGHAGLPVVVFPSSQGRFYEFEDRGMIGSIAYKIDNGEVQLYCLDSVDAESWYNRSVPPRWRIARHMSYESYVTDEVLPWCATEELEPEAHHASAAASAATTRSTSRFGIPISSPGFLSMSGAFDLRAFCTAIYDEDVYFNIPPHYIANLGDSWQLDALSQECRRVSLRQRLGRSLPAGKPPSGGTTPIAGVACRMDIWDTYNSHDWPTWQRMMQVYL
jgi:esterase/lipase superfamily enzyme